MSWLSQTSASPVPGTDDPHALPGWENHSARFTAKSKSTHVTIIAHGELDASNARHLADYVVRCAGQSTSILVDLSRLDFFGTAGFSALHLINVRCAGANLRWAVVPSNAVTRLLRICDPDNTLPLVKSAGMSSDGDDESSDENRLFEFVP